MFQRLLTAILIHQPVQKLNNTINAFNIIIESSKFGANPHPSLIADNYCKIDTHSVQHAKDSARVRVD
jgi:hypothetical protein